MKINVSRFIQREKAEFSVEVLTPMFLGGASGDAELRAAPFKNALRYWWRITQGNFSHEKLREEEQKLFGGVYTNKITKEKTRRSLVDVVVTGSVKMGNVGEMDFIGKKRNPEANNKAVPLSAYLGMGPVDFNGKYTKNRILPGETFNLSIIFPIEKKSAITGALSLLKSFGGLGARSRNGWGSFELKILNDSISLLPRKALFEREKYGEELSAILTIDKKYPFRLGLTNAEPLLWRIGEKGKWQDAMKIAGESYMDLRQQKDLKFPNRRQGNSPENRHILGYPVTNHTFYSWGDNNGRMSSQLRIIIRKAGKGYGAYFFHLPHKIPKPWNHRLGEELAVWQTIHTYLDKNFARMS